MIEGMLADRMMKFLALYVANPTELTTQFARDLISSLIGIELFASGAVRLSVELINHVEKTWCIAASTDSNLKTGIDFTIDQGLTGWTLKSKRNTYFHVLNREALPRSVQLLPGFENIQSAFVYLLKPDRIPVAAICAVSDSPNVITTKLAKTLHKISAAAEAILSNGIPPRSTTEKTTLPPAFNPSAIESWIVQRLESTPYPWANFWPWDALTKTLTPRQVTSELRELGAFWLRPLALGEGFVGKCALDEETIIENQIFDKKGVTTEIDTPLAEIQPGMPLRSIIATPVKDNWKFFGVLSILGETAHQFDDDDVAMVESIAKELSTLLRRADEEVIAEIQREVRDKLLRSLIDPQTPTKYWKTLSSIFELISRKGLCERAILYVAKRHMPTVFTCKSASKPYLADNKSHEIGSDQALNMLVQLPQGLHKIEQDQVPIRSLFPPTISRMWLDSHAFGAVQSVTPTLILVAALSNDTIWSPPFGRIELYQALNSISTAVFATTRAILTASDMERISRERRWLMASETHDFRQPLTTIRGEAESLEDLEEENLRHRNKIITKTDDLLVKVENMLYSNWFMDGARKGAAIPREDTEKAEINLPSLLQELISEVKARNPGQVINFKSQQGQEFIILAQRRWLSIALRNILDNAVKFGLGAPIDVTLQLHEEGGLLSTLTQITDHGIGIPEKEQGVIFNRGHKNPYSRKYNVTGSQIALSVTRDIIQSHGGRVWVKSKIKEGATFFINIPLFQGKAK